MTVELVFRRGCHGSGNLGHSRCLPYKVLTTSWQAKRDNRPGRWLLCTSDSGSCVCHRGFSRQRGVHRHLPSRLPLPPPNQSRRGRKRSSRCVFQLGHLIRTQGPIFGGHTQIPRDLSRSLTLFVCFCCLGWPGIHHVHQDGLEVTEMHPLQPLECGD